MFGQQDDAAPVGADGTQAPADNTDDTQQQYAPVDDAGQAPATDLPEPQQEEPETEETPAPEEHEEEHHDEAPSADAASFGDHAESGSDDLLSLKHQALQQLAPLVSQLDQSPEEKFRTTMMMIQATDDKALLQAAYEAANAIPDEKAKAQALLDVVNEINYFTQQHEHEE